MQKIIENYLNQSLILNLSPNFSLLYFYSLKQSGKFPGNPWPPYKKRTPLHPSYKGLMRLLHCKTLHIVLFTLLYKVQ